MRRFEIGKNLGVDESKLIDVLKCWLEGFLAFGLDGELWEWH